MEAVEALSLPRLLILHKTRLLFCGKALAISNNMFSEMERVLIEPHFLPSLEFFCAISPFDNIELEYYEHYVKQSYRNHAIINTANGPHKLVVPLVSKGNRTLMKDLLIDYSQNWQNNFWRTLESAYRKSPFYEHFANDLRDALFKKDSYLVDLNFNLLQMCFTWLKWRKEITTTTGYNKTTTSCDLRNVLLSKKPYSSRKFYKPVLYTQVFGSAFVGNVSIVDLIFCKGTEAGGIIEASRLNL